MVLPTVISSAVRGAECGSAPVLYRVFSKALSPTNINSDFTIAIQGFHSVKASKMWAARVVTTAHKTQMMFFPVLSTRIPNIGDVGADMTYTILSREYERSLMKCMTSKKSLKPLGKPNRSSFHLAFYLAFF